MLRSCDRMTAIRTIDAAYQTGQDSDKLWVQRYWANTWTGVSEGCGTTTSKNMQEKEEETPSLCTAWEIPQKQ